MPKVPIISLRSILGFKAGAVGWARNEGIIETDKVTLKKDNHTVVFQLLPTGVLRLSIDDVMITEWP